MEAGGRSTAEHGVDELAVNVLLTRYTVAVLAALTALIVSVVKTAGAVPDPQA